MKLFVAFSLLIFVVLANATQWEDIKDPLDSPRYKKIMEKFLAGTNVSDGKKIEGKITNGDDAVLGQFPYQVYMYLYEGTGARYLCGGSVINF